MGKRILVVLAMLLGSVIAYGPAPAYASSTGCGNLCDGRDPGFVWFDSNEVAHKCSADAVTKRSVTRVIFGLSYTVELRYSAACRTAWARGNQVNSGDLLQVESYYTNGALRVTTPAPPGLNTYSAMVNDAGLLAQACIYVSGSGGGLCTTRY